MEPVELRGFRGLARIEFDQRNQSILLTLGQQTKLHQQLALVEGQFGFVQRNRPANTPLEAKKTLRLAL